LLARSREPEDQLLGDRRRTQALLASMRKQGFAERDPMVEPRSSGTIAVPVAGKGKVLATVGMSYFMSALDRRDVSQRYAPLIRTLADNVSSSVALLR
jgi:hypothetical protein